MTYEETMSNYIEAISLGYSPKQVVNDLDTDDADEKALQELKNLVEYGI